MIEYLIPLLILLLSLPLILSLARANELFVLRWDGRELRRVRGRIPARLLDDLSDVMRRAGKAQGAEPGIALRGVVADERAQLRVGGALTPALSQRLRNTLAVWPLAKIRAAKR